MPNWVSNTLRVIKGDPKEVFKFVCTDKSVFDFNTLVPMPEQVKSSTEQVGNPVFARSGHHEILMSQARASP